MIANVKNKCNQFNVPIHWMKSAIHWRIDITVVEDL